MDCAAKLPGGLYNYYIHYIYYINFLYLVMSTTLPKLNYSIVITKKAVAAFVHLAQDIVASF